MRNRPVGILPPVHPARGTGYHGVELARKLAVAGPDRLTSAIDEEVTELLRKDETHWPPP
ncbi:hypothetical protein [Nocardia sp. NPDC049707]|uniref:hypothetical protein n=1 Tax=Nocardia sp. NPDC049707 TaxID=3154735 RepID=UPI003442A8D7